MPFVSLAQAIASNSFANVRLIATDMDGTLTISGKFTTQFLQGLEQLKQAGLPVLIVTGRSAGWVSGLVNYLPVSGAIAENGGIFYRENAELQQSLVALDDLTLHRQQLAKIFQHLQSKFPQIQEAADNRFRSTDWTFDIQNLSLPEIQQINRICHDLGWGFTYSTVQCHIKLLTQNKADGLRQVLTQHFPSLLPEQVLTVGDSPNDETLFNPDQFPLSVGVANVLEYRDQLNYSPAFVTTKAAGEGFCELVRALLEKN